MDGGFTASSEEITGRLTCCWSDKTSTPLWAIEPLKPTLESKPYFLQVGDKVTIDIKPSDGGYGLYAGTGSTAPNPPKSEWIVTAENISPPSRDPYKMLGSGGKVPDGWRNAWDSQTTVIRAPVTRDSRDTIRQTSQSRTLCPLPA